MMSVPCGGGRGGRGEGEEGGWEGGRGSVWLCEGKKADGGGGVIERLRGLVVRVLSLCLL